MFGGVLPDGVTNVERQYRVCDFSSKNGTHTLKNTFETIPREKKKRHTPNVQTTQFAFVCVPSHLDGKRGKKRKACLENACSNGRPEQKRKQTFKPRPNVFSRLAACQTQRKRTENAKKTPATFSERLEICSFRV